MKNWLVLILMAAFSAGAADELRYDFPIYKNKASGRQLSGQHAPATSPALAPEESRKAFKVPAGFEVRLFASEPAVVNPVAMTWDERGRLWVLELYEYPLGAKPGERGRDRIKILEDTDGDGRADKVTVFADGLNLATGLLLGNGGVYVGQAPDLLFLQDTTADPKLGAGAWQKANSRTVVKTGFGLNDRHELLNGFTWGPDGWLYMTHGVFTISQVRTPGEPDSNGVAMNAAVARFHPRTKVFEVFADGTSNPWGVDFDRTGNAFVSACVIDHLFHMAPGGIYVRQGGTPSHPYAYELLPSIVAHKHYMAAYAGINIYQGSQYPKEWQGEVLFGNIHQSALNHDHLTVAGSSFKSEAKEDFLTTTDGWFRPVSTQTGPDGALWIMDWYDKYPCYQNANADPEGVDREYGRIWRVVHVGDKPGQPVASRPEVKMDLAALSSGGLMKLLSNSNVWQRRMAQRLLTERKDASIVPALAALAESGASLDGRLAALWTLHGSGLLEESLLETLAGDRETALRTWAARLTGERRQFSDDIFNRLVRLAGDPEAAVRLGVATAARQMASGSLTIDTPVTENLANARIGILMAALMKSSGRENDPLLGFLIWMAGEPQIARDASPALGWILNNAAEVQPLGGRIVRKIMRRLCDSQENEKISLAFAFVNSSSDKSPELASAALDGLIEAQKGKAHPPQGDTAEVFAKLAHHSDAGVRERAQRLGTLWGDAAALQKTLELVDDTAAPVDDRLRAVAAARQLKTDGARAAMLKLLSPTTPEVLAVEGVRALGEMGGGAEVGKAFVQGWKGFSGAVRRAAADVLVSRTNWSGALLDGVELKIILPSEIPVTALRSLFQSGNPGMRGRAEQLIGRFRESDADKLKVIAEKKKVVLAGTPDIEAGHEVAKKTCFLCHKLHGEGADVGPDLTGVGRSTLDALLANVIDPNQVIGKGYENVVIETKDGRSVSGRMTENTDTRVKILSAGPKEDVVAKSEIASLRVTEISVMPEGLEQMPEADFRNLIWFILNPPGDNRPLTPAVRRQLIGDPAPGRRASNLDAESAAVQKAVRDNEKKSK